jgi:hypothetical protein
LTAVYRIVWSAFLTLFALQSASASDSGASIRIIKDFYARSVAIHQGLFTGLFRGDDREAVEQMRKLIRQIHRTKFLSNLGLTEPVAFAQQRIDGVIDAIAAELVRDGADAAKIKNQIGWLKFWSKNMLIWSYLLTFWYDGRDFTEPSLLSQLPEFPLFRDLYFDLSFFANQFGHFIQILQLTPDQQHSLFLATLANLPQDRRFRQNYIKVVRVFELHHWQQNERIRAGLNQQYRRATAAALRQLWSGDLGLLGRYKKHAMSMDKALAGAVSWILGPWFVGSETIRARELAQTLYALGGKQFVRRTGMMRLFPWLPEGPALWAASNFLFMTYNVGMGILQEARVQATREREQLARRWRVHNYWFESGFDLLSRLQTSLPPIDGMPYLVPPRPTQAPYPDRICQELLTKK